MTYNDPFKLLFWKIDVDVAFNHKPEFAGVEHSRNYEITIQNGILVLPRVSISPRSTPHSDSVTIETVACRRHQFIGLP